MSSFAIVFGAEGQSPRVVRLADDGGGLLLSSSDGREERIAWWKLYRLEDNGTTHRFRRLDRKDWELRATAGSDRALLAHVGRKPFHRFLHPLRRIESLKVLAGVVVLGVTLAQHAPAEWGARLIPERMQSRLMDSVIAQMATSRCSYGGGEAALRKILDRLDPVASKSVQVVAFNEGGYVVTSVPGRTIVVMHGALAEFDPNALAALLAHELSHVRHGDAIVAAVRHNGTVGMWATILEGSGRGELRMEFSGIEERRADLEAMQMMRNAGIPLKPAADMFEQMRVSRAQGGYYAFDQRDFHFGIDARARRWAAAAANDPPNPRPLLTRDEEDALFNFCWTGPIKPLPGEARQPMAVPLGPPGTGGVDTQPSATTKK